MAIPTRDVARDERGSPALPGIRMMEGMLTSTAGRLLVATPLLTDPNFDRTVIYVCIHDDNGAFGVVLNRPVNARAAELVPAWAAYVSPPGALHAGGPVDRSSFLALGRMPAGSVPDWWTPISRGIGMVNLGGRPDGGDDLEALRVFHGYAGWGPQQLDAELTEQAWFVVGARPEDPFTQDPYRLWSDVLRRQHGSAALYSTYPREAKWN